MSEKNDFFGRTVLYTNETEITSKNVGKVLADVLPDFRQNKEQIDYLYNYWRGNQPILQREKKIRPEINNKLVENHAQEIVSFKSGYTFGEPIQYIRRATKSGTDVPNNVPMEQEDLDITQKITTLNEYMFSRDKFTQDKMLSEWFFICGTGYRMVLPTDDTVAEEGECPFDFDWLDPRYTAVVYSRGFGKKPLMGFQEVQTDDGLVYGIYTKDNYHEILLEEGTSDEDIPGLSVKTTPHLMGDVPIIEYPANFARIGSFEVVLGLLDKINTVDSNRVDGIEQFIQSFLKCINVKLESEDIEKLDSMGCICFTSAPDRPADISLVSSELNQGDSQTVVDHLYQQILIICGMPDRNGAAKTSGDTGQAVMLRDGWTLAEAKSKDVEAMFEKSEKQFLKIVLKILMDKEKLEIKLSDIGIKFIPNKTDNLLSKTQSLQTMLEAGIHPQIAIQKCGLFGDPEQAYQDSIPYLEKWKKSETGNKEDDDSAKQPDDTEPVVPANNKPIPKE